MPGFEGWDSRVLESSPHWEPGVPSGEGEEMQESFRECQERSCMYLLALSSNVTRAPVLAEPESS